ncbi:MAG: ATP-dependent Clp protease proteolytic subunit [Azospirillaceae bacterium]
MTREMDPTGRIPARLDEEPDETRERKQDTPFAMMAQRLFEARTVMIFGEIDMRLARDVTAQLLALSAASDDPIKVVVNSPGGHVESGDTIYDMIRFIKPEVKMIGTGWVASAGALIYASAKLENRFCLPNTRFLLHQPMGGVRGPAVDIGIEAQEIVKMRERINRILADATGQSYEKIETDTDRNFWMSAEEAKSYGLVGKVVNSMTEVV